MGWRLETIRILVPALDAAARANDCITVGPPGYDWRSANQAPRAPGKGKGPRMRQAGRQNVRLG